MQVPHMLTEAQAWMLLSEQMSLVIHHIADPASRQHCSLASKIMGDWQGINLLDYLRANSMLHVLTAPLLPHSHNPLQAQGFCWGLASQP